MINNVNAKTQFPLQPVSGSIKTFAKNAPQGITHVLTGKSTTDLPYEYCAGFVIRRATDESTVVLFSVHTLKIYVGGYSGDTWMGWATIPN